MILGISGYAQSGKDTAAQALVEDGWTRVAFADKLREFLYAANPIVGAYVKGSDLITIYLQGVIDEYGWGGYKETEFGPEIRRLLQKIGTEAGRKIISDTIWVDAALGDSYFGYNIVITDVRFPNEVEAIKERGGMIIRINREGVGPANNHPSETALDDYKFDAVITNTTVEKLHRKIRAFGSLGQPRI